jgi:hypothetical protein
MCYSETCANRNAYCSISHAIVQLVRNDEVFFLSPRYESCESNAIPPGNTGISAALKISVILWHPPPPQEKAVVWDGKYGK